MKNVQTPIYHFISFLLILLWVYAATSKLISFSTFRAQMHMQPFPPFLQTAIIYLLPPAELLLAGLIAIESTTRAGLIATLVLLAIFSGYTGLAAFHFFPKRPCACGGILTRMGWTAHFFFNLTLTGLTLVSLYILNRKERQA